MKSDNLNNIREVISEGNLKKALESLWDHSQNAEWTDEAILIRRRFSSFEEKKVKGLLYRQDEVVEENQITYQLLELLNRIEEQLTDAYLHELETGLDDPTIVKKLLEILEETFKGFTAQAKIRNLLVSKIENRLSIRENLQYEEFFEKYFPAMTEEELKYHHSIRDYTKNILNKYNRKALELILGNEDLQEEVPRLKELERHLLVWLGKYESVFHHTPSMSLIYVGVKEKVPFPSGIEEELKNYLKDD